MQFQKILSIALRSVSLFHNGRKKKKRIITWAEAVIFSLSWVVNEAEASVASFSQGSYRPGPPAVKQYSI